MTQLVREQKREPTTHTRTASRPKVAYIVSRFPKLTETFVLYEMLAVEEEGVQVELYPLMRARRTSTHAEGASVWTKILERLKPSKGSVVMHPEAASLVERAHFQPFLSLDILRANLRYLLRMPRRYVDTLWTLVRANWGSANYLLAALAIFPKTAHFAESMESSDIDHIHAHFANHPAAAAFIIHRLTGIPYSFTGHGADLQVDQHMLCEKVSDADFVVTISNYNVNFIARICGETAADKVSVIRCGVDTSVFQPPSPNGNHRVDDAGTQLKIACIGTLYEVKGHTYLIEACRLLKERGVAFTCRLAGDGPYLETLQDQVEHAGLAEHVNFLGQRTRAEIVELLGSADVLVLPSIPTSSGRREGIPVVLMEAMGSGVPVVASNISGIPELVEDRSNGVLVPPRDPHALAAALEELQRDSTLRRRLGAAGRETVLREFDLHTNAVRLVQGFRGEHRS